MDFSEAHLRWQDNAFSRVLCLSLANTEKPNWVGTLVSDLLKSKAENPSGDDASRIHTVKLDPQSAHGAATLTERPLITLSVFERVLNHKLAHAVEIPDGDILPEIFDLATRQILLIRQELCQATFSNADSVDRVMSFLFSCFARATRVLEKLNALCKTEDLPLRLKFMQFVCTIIVKNIVVYMSGVQTHNYIAPKDAFFGLHSVITWFLSACPPFIELLTKECRSIETENENSLNAAGAFSVILSFVGESFRKIIFDSSVGWSNSMRAVSAIAAHFPASLMHHVSNFNPPAEYCKLPRAYESRSFFAPMFSPSVMYFDAPYYCRKIDSNIADVPSNDAQALLSDVTSAALSYHDSLFLCLDGVFRESPGFFELFAEFARKSLALNITRARMEFDDNVLSGYGFCDNLSLILLRLYRPFIKHADLVDPRFLLSKNCTLPREQFNSVGISESEFKELLQSDKENATEASTFTASAKDSSAVDSSVGIDLSAAQVTAENLSKPHKAFSNEGFYLTHLWLHIGHIRNLREYMKLQDKVEMLRESYKKLKSFIEEHEANSANNVNSSANAFFYSLELRKVQSMLNEALCQKYTLKPFICNSERHETILQFYSFTAKLMLDMVLNRDIENSQSSLESGYSDKRDLDFKILPEFMLENILDYVSFLCTRSGSRNIPVYSGQIDTILELCVVLLNRPNLISNPFLKVKIVQKLYLISQDDTMCRDFCNLKISKIGLVPGLMSFYVGVDRTGLSNMFYEKFSVRYEISKVLQNVWDHASHRAHVLKLSKTEVFVTFVNMMMSDTSYLLDEGLSKLSAIALYEKEHRSKQQQQSSAQNEEGGSQNNDLEANNVDENEERSDEGFDVRNFIQGTSEERARRETHRRNRQLARTFMTLATQTLETFKYMSQETKAPFLTEEIVDRLAAMLDYNIAALVGEKCLGVKVHKPLQYNFSPARLLDSIVQVILNLGDEPRFVKAAALDERSFSSENYKKAGGLLRSCDLRDIEQVKRLEDFAKKVDDAILENLDTEIELGEIPDEFLDPIMCTIMDDPVILPSSGKVVDRRTIASHLLGDQRDPFNRQPLTIAEVVPNKELHIKIQEFKQAAKAKAKLSSMTLASGSQTMQPSSSEKL